MKLEDEEQVRGSRMRAEDEASARVAPSEEMSPALRAMVAELRAEEPPALPWDTVERSLMLRIARGEGGRPQPRGGQTLRQLAPICAAAAAIALAVNLGASSSGSVGRSAAQPAEARLVDASLIARAPGAAGDRGDRDLSLLREGSAVETAGAPITFTREGVVRWTLSPASRAIVRSSGAPSGVGMVVSLERGSLRAEVTPRAASEGLVDAFSVESGGTRVAVHGTAFTVIRAEQSLVVDVEHGVVAVGPAGHRGATTGYSLVGPSRASFSLDGGRIARFLRHEEQPVAVGALAAVEPPTRPVSAPLAVALTEPAAARPMDHAGQHAEHTGHPAPAPIAAAAPVAQPIEGSGADKSPPTPAAPEAAKLDRPADPPSPPAVVWLTPSSVKSRIERCIKDAQSARPTSVTVSIASTLTVRVDEGGGVVSARLNPPLAPHLSSCAGAGIAGKFASGPQTLAIPLTVDAPGGGP